MQPPMDESKHTKTPSFFALLRTHVTVKRALKVAAIIGTLLIAINQGDVILAGGMPPLWKIILTYCVPYGVSSYSTAALLREQARELLKAKRG